MAKQKEQTLPEWEKVLSSISQLQKILPDAVLVGGSATAIHASHRLSRDHDHTVQGLTEKFDDVLKDLEAVAGWKTARVQRPVLILGSLDGIETGVRNLKRSAPLETEVKVVGTVSVLLPTEAEALRIKVFLALSRNATRDYMDLVALFDRLGDEASIVALNRMDELYPQDVGREEANKWVVRTQMVKQLGQPEPYDLDEVDLGEYKGVKAPYDKWEYISKRCEELSAKLLSAFSLSLEHEQNIDAEKSKQGLQEWEEARRRGERVELPKFPPQKGRTP